MAGFRTGIASVTFRRLTPAEVIALVKQGGLQGIEWAGDSHAPPGELGRAREVAGLTRAAGLDVAGYGSYFRLGGGADFRPILETAAALGAPVIRIWAGDKPSSAVSAAARAVLAAELHRHASEAAKLGIVLSLEHHENTLADSAQATSDLIVAAGHPPVRTHWQMLSPYVAADQFAGFRHLVGHVVHLHVFWREADSKDCLPLAQGRGFWEKLLQAAKEAKFSHSALIEFVKAGSPDQFLEDARALREIVQSVIF